MKADKIEHNLGMTHIEFRLSQVKDGMLSQFMEWIEDRCVENNFRVAFHFLSDDKELIIYIRSSFDFESFKDGWVIRELLNESLS